MKKTSEKQKLKLSICFSKTHLLSLSNPAKHILAMSFFHEGGMSGKVTKKTKSMTLRMENLGKGRKKSINEKRRRKDRKRKMKKKQKEERKEKFVKLVELL
jgi:hypothetical protein